METATISPDCQALGPSVGVPPDPLRFPLTASLSAKPPPPPHLTLVHGLPGLTPPPPQSPKVLEEEGGQGEPTEQDATLDEICKPLYCKLCNVTLNSAQQAQAHYQGKNHSKKLRNFYAGSQQPPPIRIPEVIEPVSQQPLTTPPTESATSCKQPPPFKGASRVILATENDYCKLCDASFSSPARCCRSKSEAVTERRNGVQTDEEPKKRTRPYYNPRPRQRIPRDLAMCVTPSGQFYCSMCNSGASEEADFRLHLESKQHKSKVSEQRYRSEMENLGYT
ncbi:hypothetical protein JZ751_025079 [Albula glossodonta]|uniref:Zinc finger matrin-type protein 3 n=1 Tax=Albula glossodonta TaxID=121402 RepID=A0A8T2PGA3_9TELE|nr:hypothetical protein JZ751_025079 [Albula glossodonta]